MRRIVNGLQSVDLIDQFVDDCRNEPFVPVVAKLAIAHCILEAERESQFGSLNQNESQVRLRNFRDSWLGQICRRANPKTSRQRFPLTLANTTFIVFNYDRCVEQYILHYASNTLDKPVDKVGEMVREIPILHPFGTLGLLSPIALDGNAGIGFGSSEHLSYAAKGIKTFTEEVDSEHGQRIRDVCGNASTIVFLGFHYHPQNMEILFRRSPMGKRIFGTTYAMSDRRTREIESWFTEDGNDTNLEGLTCGEFLAKYGEDIFT